jgi:hypothetical protein
MVKNIELHRFNFVAMLPVQLKVLTNMIIAASAYSLTVTGKLLPTDDVSRLFAGLLSGYGLVDQCFRYLSRAAHDRMCRRSAWLETRKAEHDWFAGIR